MGIQPHSDNWYAMVAIGRTRTKALLREEVGIEVEEGEPDGWFTMTEKGRMEMNYAMLDKSGYSPQSVNN